MNFITNISNRKHVVFIVLVVIFVGIALIITATKDANQEPSERASHELLPAFSECLSQNRLSWRTTCMENLASSLQEKFGTRTVIEAVRLLEQQKLIGGLECHGFTHQVGAKTLQSTEGSLAESFVQCGTNPACGLGCQHGAIEEHASTQGISDINSMKNICSDLDQELFSEESAVRYACAHGLGHAAMFTLQNDYVTALRWCDGLDPAEQELCYIGASMEDAFTSIHEGDPETLDSLLSRCSDIPEKYQKICYLSRVPLMANTFGSDWKSTLSLCEGALSEDKDICILFTSYNAVSIYNDVHRTWSDVCLSLEEGVEQSHCIQGIIEGRASFGGGDMAEAFGSFCSQLPNTHEYRETCAYISGVVLDDFGDQKSNEKCELYFDETLSPVCKLGVTDTRSSNTSN